MAEHPVIAPAEAARRRGKKTGLGAPGEKPQVIVEKLLRAMARGQVDARRFLDPERAVLDVLTAIGDADDPPSHHTHRCADARTRLVTFLRDMVEHEIWSPEDSAITCSSEFAERPGPFRPGTEESPGPTVRIKHIRCRQLTQWHVSSHLYQLEWVPDAKRGWRVAAFTESESREEEDMQHAMLADLAKPARCPVGAPARAVTAKPR
ncbi:MAG: hypothetical protein EOO75_14420 [Myxococcales bacterium]|nr:MAG: hypothetical protein EOO75_14420 [Myxococcales bacterium]